MRTPSVFAIVTAFVFGAALLLSSTTTASAQGIALSRFDPAERGSRFFAADSLELHTATAAASTRLPPIAAGLTSSYAYRTRTFGDSREGERSRLVEHALFIHPGASVVVAPGARFALDMPIAAVHAGESTNLAGNYYLAPLSPRLGDLRASFDLRLFGPSSRDEDGVAIAAGVRGWIPTGSPDDFTGEESARFGFHASAAARFGHFLAAARVGYMYRRDGTVGSSQIGSEMTSVIAVAYADKLWTIGPELHGATLIDRFFRTKNTPLEVIAGLHRRLGAFRAGAGVGTSLVSGLGAPHVRALLSFEWTPAPPEAQDRDGDGVGDPEDACPDVPGPKEAGGCPPAPRDTDGDGIIDSEDACVDTPGPRTQDPKTYGCPVIAPDPPQQQQQQDPPPPDPAPP